MTAAEVAPSTLPPRLAVVGDACGCAHAFELHHPAGPCVVSLPPFDEEEMPAWRCPCRKYVPAQAPAGSWRWHEASQSWALPRPRAAS